MTKMSKSSGVDLTASKTYNYLPTFRSRYTLYIRVIDYSAIELSAKNCGKLFFGGTKQAIRSVINIGSTYFVYCVCPSVGVCLENTVFTVYLIDVEIVVAEWIR